MQVAPLFSASLHRLAPPGDSARRWCYVAHDQLHEHLHEGLAGDPTRIGVVLIESRAFWRRRPYHRQKLAVVFANQRHFALEQARRGVAVRYLFTNERIADCLRAAIAELGPLDFVEPAERELRVELAPLCAAGMLRPHSHRGWLTERGLFQAAFPSGPPFRMDAFYRRARHASGYLMERGQPVGGKYSFDAENRLPWRGDPPAPEPPRFTPDPVTAEVGEEVQRDYADHPGRLDLSTIPATAKDADLLWRWAREESLEHFGPYEDAMTTRSSGLFHTRLSTLLNLHRLLPRVVAEDALALSIPLSSKEGFLRQILGWREFVRHVHEATDGFREIPGAPSRTAPHPGDGGRARWSGAPWPQSPPPPGIDGGAATAHLGEGTALPPAYWGVASGLACLDHVVEDVWREGWSHHITRLMVLSNIATLLDFSARELTDWFWIAYTDAWDWVVEPNVLAMGTFSTGELMTTKPYVSGTPYLRSMSDYCEGCNFDAGKNCPISRFYWAFLARHEAKLARNQRLAMPLRSLAKRSAAERAEDRRVAALAQARLLAGKPLRPADSLPKPAPLRP